MPTSGPSPDQREFRCIHCNGKILIPKDLPPTTGPCPHCKQAITSPEPDPVRITAEVVIPTTPVVREVPVVPAAPPIPRSPAPPSADLQPAEAPLESGSGKGGVDPVPESPPVDRNPMDPNPDRSSGSPVREHAAGNREDNPELSEASPGSVGIGTESVPDLPNRAKNRTAPRADHEKRRSGVWVPLAVAASLVAAAGATWIFVSGMLSRGNATPPVDPALMNRINQERYRQTGWQEEARSVLEQFLSARTTSGKAAWSLRGAELLPAMEEFYAGTPIDDSDTPVGAFSAMELPAKDTDRGIHVLVYDLPPQFELKEFFRPLVPLDVQFGLERADVLLQSVTQISNFESEPLKVYAFFKRTSDGLRLDWETFVQTKHRTFRDFTEIPEAGRSGIFRVYLLEDVPEKGRAPAGTRTYRVVDPAHTSDAVRVTVPVDSEMGRALSILNWRGVKDARPDTRTATVELEWSQEESPRVLLKRFICWEFLGLGGDAVNPGAGR